MTAVVVAGALANKPGSAGEAWVRMSWVRGLERLGLDVWFVEELVGRSTTVRGRVVPRGQRAGSASQERAALIAGGETIVGPLARRPAARLRPRATLVNISGHLALPAPLRRVPAAGDGRHRPRLHAVLARRRGSPGAQRRGPRPPLHDRRADRHAELPDPDRPGSTGAPCASRSCSTTGPSSSRTMATASPRSRSWRGAVRADRARRPHATGSRSTSSASFIELPVRSAHEFEIALDIHPADDADRQALEQHGWSLVDPRRVAGDIDAFRAYVQGSAPSSRSPRASTSTPRAAGSATAACATSRRAGPRSSRTRASSRILPAGEGLVAFRTLEEAVAGADDIVARYAEHAAAARRIAEECFAAERVLARFTEEAGIV